MAEVSAEQNQRLTDTIQREQGRLRRFILRHVPDRSDAEDILQDVFFEPIAAFRLTNPVEHVTTWLFRVARNRIIDRSRKTKDRTLNAVSGFDDAGEELSIDDLLPSAEAGPEAAYARSVLIAEFENALDELPAAQRDVFLAHEFEGKSFKELCSETGESLNTLLSRKRYAILHLRQRLQTIYEQYPKGS